MFIPGGNNYSYLYKNFAQQCIICSNNFDLCLLQNAFLLTAIIKERRWKKDGRKQGQEEKRKKETEENSKIEVILFLLSK